MSWINVNERMPEASAAVLVVTNGRVTLGWTYETYAKQEIRWRTPSLSNAQVTHWMPLPEPPKEAA